MNKEMVFLDTTIHIDRYYGLKSERDQIKDTLKGKNIVTSNYVLGEFVNNMVQETIIFYEILSDDATISVAEGLVRLSKIGQRKPRIYNRVHKIINSLDSGLDDKKEVMKRLELLIDKIYLRRLKKVDTIINEVGCIRYESKITKDENGYEYNNNCTVKQKPKCNVAVFLNERRDIINEILDNGKPEHICSCVNEIIVAEKAATGTRCWKIGDLIISLEMPGNAKLFTTNVRDFDPLCKILKKELL